MTYVKYLLLFITVFGWQLLNAQTFFKNSKVIANWRVGNTKSKEARLQNGATLVIDFDGFTLNVTIQKKDKKIILHKFDQGGPWNKLEISEYDFEKDGKNEIAITYGDTETLLFALLVYKIKNNAVIEIANLEGQSSCSFYKNTIAVTQGSKGLLSKYVLRKGKFIKKRRAMEILGITKPIDIN